MVTIVALKFAMSSHFPLPKKIALFVPTLSSVEIVLPIEKMNQINTKNYWNRKRDCAWGCARGINTTRENQQIAKHKSGRRSFCSPDWFVLCDLQIFSSGVYPPSRQPHAQSLFLFPIVFGINNSIHRLPENPFYWIRPRRFDWEILLWQWIPARMWRIFVTHPSCSPTLTFWLGNAA